MLTSNEKTLSQLAEELYNTPPDSPKFSDKREEFESHLTGDKYDEQIVAFKSKMHPYMRAGMTHPLHRINGLVNVDVSETEDMFTAYESFLEDGRFTIAERRELEFNPLYRQLVVSVIFKGDANLVMLLKTKTDADTRLSGRITMVQGHVDFTSDMYIQSKQEFLWNSLMRELYEEVQVPEWMDLVLKAADKTPKFYMNDKTTTTGIEHFGIIYEIDLGEALVEYGDKIESNEPDKHDVVVLPLSSVQASNALDPWTARVCAKLISESMTDL